MVGGRRHFLNAVTNCCVSNLLSSAMCHSYHVSWWYHPRLSETHQSLPVSVLMCFEIDVLMVISKHQHEKFDSNFDDGDHCLFSPNIEQFVIFPPIFVFLGKEKKMKTFFFCAPPWCSKIATPPSVAVVDGRHWTKLKVRYLSGYLSSLPSSQCFPPSPLQPPYTISC